MAVLVIIIIVLLGFLIWHKLSSDKLMRTWNRVAERLDLKSSSQGVSIFGTPTIKGRIESILVKVDIIQRGSGRNSQSYTRYQAQFPKALGFGFFIRTHGMLDNIAKIFGAEDIEIGDPSFDSSYLIRGGDPETIRKYLTQYRRDCIAHLLSQFGEVEITGETIEGLSSGKEGDENRIMACIQAIVKCTRMLDPSDDGVEFPIGDDHSLEALESEFGEEYWMEGTPETIVEPENLDQSIPEEPIQIEQVNILSEESVTQEKKGEAELSNQEIEEPIDTNEQEEGPPIEALCVQLFSGSVYRSDAEKAFEPLIGKRVRWTGTLRSVTSMSYDFDFGEGEAAKGIFEIYETVSDLGFKSSVAAIVKFSHDVLKHIDQHQGQLCVFEGNLRKIGSLSPEIFLDEGVLLGRIEHTESG